MLPTPARTEAPGRAEGRRARGGLAALGDFWRVTAAIIVKDLAAEFRSRELFSAMLVFSLLVVLIFNFALELDRSARENVAAGVLWATFIFAGTLGFNRSLSMEKDRGSLDGLLLAPVDRSALFFGKALGNLIFMAAVEAVILPVFSLLFNLSMFHPVLLLAAALGTLGYSAVGTLLASMAVHTRARDVMLPILLFPVAVPILVAAVRASEGALSGLAWAEVSTWINLLLVYDAVFLAVAYMVFDFVVEE